MLWRGQIMPHGIPIPFWIVKKKRICSPHHHPHWTPTLQNSTPICLLNQPKQTIPLSRKSVGSLIGTGHNGCPALTLKRSEAFVFLVKHPGQSNEGAGDSKDAKKRYWRRAEAIQVREPSSAPSKMHIACQNPLRLSSWMSGRYDLQMITSSNHAPFSKW